MLFAVAAFVAKHPQRAEEMHGAYLTQARDWQRGCKLVSHWEIVTWTERGEEVPGHYLFAFVLKNEGHGEL